MPYIGNSLATQFQAFATQTITGDGSTGYTLDRGVVNGKELLVYINNVKQEEGAGKSYTASGTTITFSAAVASTDSCYLVYLGSAVQTVNPPDASVGTTQLASGAVTSAKLANANLEMPNTLDMNGNELILDADADTSIQAGSDDTMVFDTAGSERMRVHSNGSVTIGTTSETPNSADVQGFSFRSQYGEMVVSGEGSTGAPLYLNRMSSEGIILVMRNDNSTAGSLGVNGGQLYIGSGDVGLRFRYGSTDCIEPFSHSGEALRDDAIDLGHSSNRFDDIFATNGTIQTSDQNEKQDIASATTKELNVAKKLSALFKTFRWKDKVTKKGNKARTHSGIIAQEIQSAFSAEGLDASNYGLFTSNTWWEKEVQVPEVKAVEGTNIEAKEAYTYMDIKDEKTDGYTERTRLGVRYPELFSFIFSSIEARLTALESK